MPGWCCLCLFGQAFLRAVKSRFARKGQGDMPRLDFVRGFSRWKQLCLFEYLMPSETSGRAPVPYEKTDRYPTR
ncbi:hypothetical protein [Neisseria meningitidis]|uniref:hypothetical protein n=1 Tax=Neisseria meningitidis TaxID=487 RepID=UPI0015F10752|nr:hypothetical protein [Neisseria meningitidis]